MYYLVSSDCVKAHSEKVIFEQIQETKQWMSQADLGRKSVLGREKSKGTKGGGCLVCLRGIGKPIGELLKLSEGMT